ncbi:LysR family transcriptional regulator ArgP [Leeia sp. TBRC 13508]|uniref:LysR family transcriptional regulator ArgP n=1 Tax=Leeia speluncae TaxID=2884804 RepID=A0ABS8D982_9NEIS|nr:LysR family transcriptional regulator ArgP [Leeia speluncae]MCB6184755.1 LysR family transcriptional regulator ArgP [Leeia speluncae]
MDVLDFIDLKQAEALMAVAETGSFEQAAAQLFVTPSAISQRIKLMETRLGKPLVVRTRPIRVTPHGQRVLQYLHRAKLLATELANDLVGDQEDMLSVALAVNADTLSSWFLPALSDFLIKENILVDLTVDDQDYTHELLKAGMAIGCVTAEVEPMKGCVAVPLGSMRYRAVCSKAYQARWLSDGTTRESLRKAPVLVFNNKDRLQADWLITHFGLTEGSYPCHYLPASEPYLQAVSLGLGWGMLPEVQMAPWLDRAEFFEIYPDHPVDVYLYWHHWQLQTPKMERLSKHIVEMARQYLIQP